MTITKEYLQSHPNDIFVYGDNLLHEGYGGAATLRDEPNTYGFITKKAPNYDDKSYYRPDEYLGVYLKEIAKLKHAIKAQKDKTFLISKLGAGLANRYNIFEEVIEYHMKRDLYPYRNVQFLW